MAQDIVVNYRADVDDLTNKLKVVIERMDKLEKESVASAKGIDQVTKSTDKLDKELSTLGTSSKKATDNIKGFSKTAKTSLNEVGSSVKSIGLGIAASLGAAFTVDAVIQFGKASVNAFLEAQQNAEKLRFTITQVGGESEAAFQRLIDQSAQLQDITIFSDDSIQQAQTALSTFGLTADQIEELLPLLADFASATKTDIASAAQAVGAGLQGAGREFKKFGIEVSATKTPVENLAQITEGFARFQGAAAKETETLTGQLKQQANAADDLQEAIGEKLAASFVRARLAASRFFSDVIDGLLGVERLNEQVEKSDQDRLRARIEADLQGQKSINNLEIEVIATKELAEAGEELIRVQKEIIANEIKQNAPNVRRLEAEKKELQETEKVLRDIIQIEKDRARIAAQPVELTEAQLAELKKNEELLRKLQIDNIEDLKQQRIAQFEDETRRLTAQGRLRADIIKELERQLVRDLNEIDKSFGDKIQPIKLKVELEEPEALVPFDDQKQVVLKPVDATEFNDSIEAVEAKTLAGWLDNNAQMLDATTNLVNSLLGLWDLYTQKQIEDIQKVTDQQLTNLDEQGKANQDSLNKRRITETEFAILQEKLEKQKVQAQEDADKKIRALKRKQAIADKAAALIQIAIDTARAYAETLGQTGIAGIALGGIVLAAGAAQAALVAAQPIPYRRGSKDTGAKGHMAKVGEEGEEIVYMPAHSKVLPAHRTRTYGDVLDKMFEGTFDKHYMKRDISSSLVSQRRNFEEKKEKSFAQNIKESIIYQQTGLTEYELERVRRRGQNVTNANEIGQSVARAISQTIDIYRR